MTREPTNRRWFHFSLRTLLFWVVPYAALCLLVLTSCREPMMSPGEGIPLFHPIKLIAIGIITIVAIVLFWEDQRALRRQAADRAALQDRDAK